MTEETYQLLPCPFCGLAPIYQPASKNAQHLTDTYGWPHQIVHNCATLGEKFIIRTPTEAVDSKDSVFNQWNTRIGSFRVEQVREAAFHEAVQVIRSRIKNPNALTERDCGLADAAFAVEELCESKAFIRLSPEDIADVLQTIQKLQPAGSPPPTDTVGMVKWIVRSAQEELERAKADRNRAGLEERNKYLPQLQDCNNKLALLTGGCSHTKAKEVGETKEGMGRVIVYWCPDCGALKRTMTNWSGTDHPWESSKRLAETSNK